MNNQKKSLWKLIRQLRCKVNMDYIQIEEALRIGLQAIKQGVNEVKLESQYDLKNKRILAEKKELDNILHTQHEATIEKKYLSMNFWKRLKFLFKQ